MRQPTLKPTLNILWPLVVVGSGGGGLSAHTRSVYHSAFFLIISAPFQLNFQVEVNMEDEMTFSCSYIVHDFAKVWPPWSWVREPTTLSDYATATRTTLLIHEHSSRMVDKRQHKVGRGGKVVTRSGDR